MTAYRIVDRGGGRPVLAGCRPMRSIPGVDPVETLVTGD
jgi:hypothetical protein